ncbi:dual specificity protein phosphatase 14-like isoform X2 [Babylonia areolata]
MDLAMFTQIAEITDTLFLSSAAAVKGESVRKLGITHIINVTMDIPNLRMPNVESIQIQVDDLPSAHLGLYFDRCADKIHQVGRMRGKTLVHCVAGVSRSASLCIAYLMKYQSMSLEQAYKHCKYRRPVVHPNVGFFKQLVDYERRLFGRNSVRMVQSSIGWIPDIYRKEVDRSTYVYGPSRVQRHAYY